MSLLADALQPMLARGVFSANGPYAATSLSDAISAPKLGYAIAFDASSRSFELDFGDVGHVSKFLAADCRRLSTSCFQSVSGLQPSDDEKLALPWWLVRLYYAAFYGGHVVARLLGTGCCWLDTAHVTRLDAVVAAIGLTAPFKIDGGAYRCEVHQTAAKLTWTKLSIGSRGGAHEALWKLLDEVLRSAATKAVGGILPAREGQLVFAQIEAFRRMAITNGSTSWLSRTRNDMQYRLGHEVWHATSIGKTDRSRLYRLTQQWADDPMNIDLDGVARYGPLGQFCAACAFVVALCRVLILNVERRNAARSGCFVRHGPRAFANYAHVNIGT